MDINKGIKQSDQVQRDETNNKLEGRSSIPGDLPDSQKDAEKLKTEETFIELPDVKDIPGQEFINVPPGGLMADTTISSDDEEGKDVFDLEDSENLIMGTDADVSKNERAALKDVNYMPTADEDNLRNAALDNVDFQGQPLEERSFGDEMSGRKSSDTGESREL